MKTAMLGTNSIPPLRGLQISTNSGVQAQYQRSTPRRDTQGDFAAREEENSEVVEWAVVVEIVDMATTTDRSQLNQSQTSPYHQRQVSHRCRVSSHSVHRHPRTMRLPILPCLLSLLIRSQVRLVYKVFKVNLCHRRLFHRTPIHQRSNPGSPIMVNRKYHYHLQTLSCSPRRKSLILTTRIFRLVPSLIRPSLVTSFTTSRVSGKATSHATWNHWYLCTM